MGNKKEEELHKLFVGDLSHPITPGTYQRRAADPLSTPRTSQPLDTGGSFKSSTYDKSKTVATGYTGKKAFPLSAAVKGVIGRVGKGTVRRGGVTAHERGLVIKPKTYEGAGKPLDKGKSRLRKKGRS